MKTLSKEHLIDRLPSSIKEGEELTNEEKAILGKFAFLAESKFYKQNGYCFRTTKDLMSELGMTWNEVTNGLDKLEELGYLEDVGDNDSVKHFKINLVYDKEILEIEEKKIDSNSSSPIEKDEEFENEERKIEEKKKIRKVLSSDKDIILSNVAIFNDHSEGFKRLPPTSVEDRTLVYLLILKNSAQVPMKEFKDKDELLRYARGAFQDLSYKAATSICKKNVIDNYDLKGKIDAQLCRNLKYAIDYYNDYCVRNFNDEILVVPNNKRSVHFSYQKYECVFKSTYEEALKSQGVDSIKVEQLFASASSYAF